MSKNKQRKKDRKLRQSIEILKAQLNVDSESRPAAVSVRKVQDIKIDQVDDIVIKKDLTKTLVLSAMGFAAILLLWSLDITSFRF